MSQHSLTSTSEASERVLELRGLLADLHRLTGGVHSSNIDTAEAVGLGRELRRIIARSQATLEHAKARVREDAPKQAGHHTLLGPDGTEALVVIQESRPALRRGVDVEELRRTFGTDFELLFETRERVLPRPDFATEVLALDNTRQKIAINAVDSRNPTTRVSFPK